MGIKNLWNVFNPYAERKPLSELSGKIIAIDLAGWVCSSLNVVDYSVHSKHHLKNLFFRTRYLMWEDVTPVFVLEGYTPTLKRNVVAKRAGQLFRGMPPIVKGNAMGSTFSIRSRFNFILKECENLLRLMGIKCVTAPDEAEAYCAFLNKRGLVDGVISQDSDCFAYGALRVYRNFSVSSQAGLAAKGGGVDIYDMEKISKATGFGQNKIIALALLCGCDYDPEGVSGVGCVGVCKFLNRYHEKEILNKIRFWRKEDTKYSELDKIIDDKNICDNCGHLGQIQRHTKVGCGICGTYHGCNKTLWM